MKKRVVHDFIVRSRFEARVAEEIGGNPFTDCRPRVRRATHLVGKTDLFINPKELMYPGFNPIVAGLQKLSKL